MLPFTKMHGIGNDFVVIKSCGDADYNALARELCNRRRGIGADGLIVILPHDAAACAMRIFNADGSEAQMCGNGIRCVGKYLYDNKIHTSLTPEVATMSGIKKLILHPGNDGKIASVTVDMGVPAVGKAYDLHTSPDYTFSVISVSTGNPHGVSFIDDFDAIDILRDGPALECADIWPDKANIEFVRVADRHTLYQRTWERGVGETEACGTGACAAAAAAVASGRADYPLNVHLTGGTLTIDSDPATGHTLMTGAAATVFIGLINL